MAGDDSTEDRMLTQDEPGALKLKAWPVTMKREAFLHHPRHALDFYCAAPSGIFHRLTTPDAACAEENSQKLHDLVAKKVSVLPGPQAVGPIVHRGG